MAQLIDDLLAYFDAHVDELLGKYEGKVVLISKDKEVSAFDDFKTGYDSGIKNYGYGNFLLKECSRVAINAVHVINPIVAIV